MLHSRPRWVDDIWKAVSVNRILIKYTLNTSLGVGVGVYVIHSTHIHTSFKLVKV